MQLHPINTDPLYIDYASYVNDRTSVRAINSSSAKNDFHSYIKYTPQEEKNTNVSEKYEENSHRINYDSILQSNIPLVKLLKIDRAYSDKYRYEGKIFDKKETKETVQSVLKEIVKEKFNTSGNGFYIVLNQNTPGFSEDTNSLSDARKEKLSKTYNSGSEKIPGILVNMVF
jgi:hypothetical protein